METLQHGRASREVLREAWEQAELMNQEHEGDGIGGEFVPKESVWVDDAINPREGGDVDMNVAKEYAGILLSMPPIKVQRDTFRLLDGKHRLYGSYDADYEGGDVIRIEEVDISDEEALHFAFRENAAHGRPLRAQDRIVYLLRLLEHDRGLNAVKSLTEYQNITGLSRPTVIKFRDPERAEVAIAKKVERKANPRKRAPAADIPAADEAPPYVEPPYVEPEPYANEGVDDVKEDGAALNPGGEDHVPGPNEDTFSDLPEAVDEHIAGILSPADLIWWAVQVLGRDRDDIHPEPSEFARVLPKSLHDQATIFLRNAEKFLRSLDEELTFNI